MIPELRCSCGAHLNLLFSDSPEPGAAPSTAYCSVCGMAPAACRCDKPTPPSFISLGA